MALKLTAETFLELANSDSKFFPGATYDTPEYTFTTMYMGDYQNDIKNKTIINDKITTTMGCKNNNLYPRVSNNPLVYVHSSKRFSINLQTWPNIELTPEVMTEFNEKVQKIMEQVDEFRKELLKWYPEDCILDKPCE